MFALIWLDKDRRCGEPLWFRARVPNLGILGASVTGTSGAHNLALTTEPLPEPAGMATFSSGFAHCPLKAAPRVA
jgi:hypothetical protein